MTEALDPALWQDLIGKPFKLRGRGPNAYDCFGLLLELYKRRGIIILDDHYDGDKSEHNALIAARLTNWRSSPIAPGVGLLFRERGISGHVGVAIDQDRFIHAAEDIGQVSVAYLSRGWARLLIGAYTISQD